MLLHNQGVEDSLAHLESLLSDAEVFDEPISSPSMASVAAEEDDEEEEFMQGAEEKVVVKVVLVQLIQVGRKLTETAPEEEVLEAAVAVEEKMWEAARAVRVGVGERSGVMTRRVLKRRQRPKRRSLL